MKEDNDNENGVAALENEWWRDKEEIKIVNKQERRRKKRRKVRIILTCRYICSEYTNIPP